MREERLKEFRFQKLVSFKAAKDDVAAADRPNRSLFCFRIKLNLVFLKEKN